MEVVACLRMWTNSMRLGLLLLDIFCQVEAIDIELANVMSLQVIGTKAQVGYGLTETSPDVAARDQIAM